MAGRGGLDREQGEEKSGIKGGAGKVSLCKGANKRKKIPVLAGQAEVRASFRHLLAMQSSPL